MAMADHGWSPGPHQHHWQPSGQDAGVDGGEDLLLSKEGALLPGWNQGNCSLPDHLQEFIDIRALHHKASSQTLSCTSKPTCMCDAFSISSS